MKFQRVEWDDMTTRQKWTYGCLAPLVILLMCGVVSWGFQAAGITEAPPTPDPAAIAAEQTERAVERADEEAAAAAEETEAAAEAVIEEGRATNAAAEAAAAEQTEEASGVTMAKFQQLETGMSYEEVVAILGEPGTEMSRSEIMGTVTVMYSWDGKAFASNMNAMFQDNELMSKAQFGLE